MTDAAITPENLQERRFAFFLLLGLVAAFLIAAIAAGSRVYHQEQERLRLQSPAADAKPDANKKESAEGKEAADKTPSLGMGQLAGALVRDPLFLFCIMNSLLLGLGATVLGARASAVDLPHATRPVPPLRLLIAGVGGVVGFTLTAILGVGYAAYFWQDLSVGGLKVWENLWPWLIVLAVFGGLALTFASLFAVKSEERSNPTLRRLLYGFNAFLVGFLLLAILIVVNAMFVIYGTTQAIDWTQGQAATLSPTTKRVLSELDKPVEVYVMLTQEDLLAGEMETMLKNCQNYTSNLAVRFLYETSRRDQEKLNELLKRYEMLFQEGMLVVSGNNHVFIKREAAAENEASLEEEQRSMGAMDPDSRKSAFRGEQALLSALNQLATGATKSTIYVTQDSGEFSLADNPAAPPARGSRPRVMSSLKTRLEKAGYRVEPWNLGTVDQNTQKPKPIPEDASAVLIVGANESINGKLSPLMDYMKRPDSRLLLFLEPARDPQGRVMPSGFEAFLKPYGVEVGQDLVLRIPMEGQPPTLAIVAPALAALRMPGMQMDNRLESAYFALGATSTLPLLETRSLRVGPAPGFDAKPLLLTFPLIEGGTGQWAETSPVPDAGAFVTNLIRTNREEFMKKVSSRPFPVAVTVSDQAPPKEPVQPGMPPKPQEGKPRIVVFGSTTPLSNPALEQPINYFFVTSSLTWLKGRDVAVSEQAAAKTRHFYKVNLPLTHLSALRWLPPLLLLLLVVALGVGVGLLRRR